MKSYTAPAPHWTDALIGRYLRLAASGLIPAKWYLPTIGTARPNSGHLTIEIVSHCWNYAHLLIHQLSSLVNHPPQNISVIMTVYYNSEDQNTGKLLHFFSGLSIDNVQWNWRELPKPALFRRAIGRNLSAKNTTADWIWFTDCDLMFQEQCLDGLSKLLQNRTDPLVYPKVERCTSLLANDAPLMNADTSSPKVLSIDTSKFVEFHKTRATGPLQITHGDVARSSGYCDSLHFYQRPSNTWCKAYEDRAFRWLLRTQGVPLDIPGVYRIRHIHKGRYTGSKASSGLRASIRKFTSKLNEIKKSVNQ